MSHFPHFKLMTDRPIDVICMGRVAVDFYADDIGVSLADAHHFKKYLGGCAGNIAVGTARLGLTSMMFSCVGTDEMGRFVKETLVAEGVRTDLLYETPDHLTGLVLLGVKPPNEFPLLFYRENCADMQLKPEHVRDDLFLQAKALLITGTGLSKENIRQTTWHAVTSAKKHNTAVIMDLDYRPVLWGLTAMGNGETRYINSNDVTGIYQQLLPLCTILVGTEEEFCLAGGSDNLANALSTIQRLTPATLVIKSGEKGCAIYPEAPNLPSGLQHQLIIQDPSSAPWAPSPQHRGEGDIEKGRYLEGISTPIVGQAFPVEVMNVLGAGDAFMAGLLRGLLRGESWEKAATYANACGALVVTRHGCAPAIPSKQELDYFIDNPDRWKSKTLTTLHAATTFQGHAGALIKRPQGFPFGDTSIIDMQTAAVHGSMNFSCIKLAMGQRYCFNVHYEFAALLLTGRVHFSYAGESSRAERTDYFRQPPIVLHCAAHTEAEVTALTDCELLLIETANDAYFSPMLFDHQSMLEFDHRGLGLLQNTSFRHVRTVFDKRNRPESNLVVGEIITMPGRWSSYPPHYHVQPEVYHYRFSEPQGFSFGEHGEKVLRIEHNDTYQILQGGEHSHCVAPGYALYTLWFIRHLPEAAYSQPTFRDEHAWTRETGADWRVWQAEDAVS